MINWVTRRDVLNTAKSGGGWLGLIVMLAAILFVGWFWWIAGTPVWGKPSRGWRRALVVVWRSGLLAAAMWLENQQGWKWHAGSIGVLVMAGCGWVAFLRRSKPGTAAEPAA